DMALLFRLTILCLCVAGIFAAATNGLGKEKEDEPTKAPEEPTKAPEPTPAPVPVCTAGERQADTTDCHKFTECKDGAWKEDSCFWFRKFDSVTKKCVMWGATCAQ
ncbi:hypothetical protein L9G16_18525, partial [Shewanella sp. A25]|nr:hypothetical protein [Shewanella shenzhenensis]